MFELIKVEALYTLQTFVAMFVIVDPFAVVPVYLSLTGELEHA